MSEYIRLNKFDTNECPSVFVNERLVQMNVWIYICDQYIQIFDYICHTLMCCVRNGILSLNLRKNSVWKYEKKEIF